MKSDAVYKAALPLGIIGGISSHLLLPKKWGNAKHVTTAVLSFTMYMLGKFNYAPVCFERAFGPVLKDRGMARRNWATDAHNRSDQPQHKDTYVASSVDTFVQEDLMDNTSFQFDSIGTEFSSDIQQRNVFQEQEINEEPKQEKKRVTYDDLWMQHRDEQMKSIYNPRRRQVPSQWQKRAEDSETFEEEDVKHF
ncbi:uncharacterized protein LOC108626543 isoform X2 [Ceratina calcarata]|nr:uncharacterized protein LOC108626543 isoform X2 [Ceratina calcarata]